MSDERFTLDTNILVYSVDRILNPFTDSAHVPLIARLLTEP